MFERFTERARRALVLGKEEAQNLHHASLDAEHLVLGILRLEDKVAETLKRSGATIEAFRHGVEARLPGDASEGRAPQFGPSTKKVMELALREALQLGHGWVAPEHFILGMIRHGELLALTILSEVGVDTDQLRVELTQLLSGYGPAEKA